jgi:hypothetical protein
MAFIQVVEFRTSEIDQIRALEDEWERATEGTRTARRSILTRDRNDPDRYLVLVFFDSYESAMENSNLPETAAFAEKQMPLLDPPPTVLDLDVIEARS